MSSWNVAERESLCVSLSVLPLIILHCRSYFVDRQRQKQRPYKLEFIPCRRQVYLKKYNGVGFLDEQQPGELRIQEAAGNWWGQESEVKMGKGGRKLGKLCTVPGPKPWFQDLKDPSQDERESVHSQRSTGDWSLIRCELTASRETHTYTTTHTHTHFPGL